MHQAKPLIVIVDDHPREVETLSEFLSDYYEVMSVDNKHDALYIFESLQMKVRIILINMHTQNLDAIELIQKMRKINTMPEIITFADYEDIDICVQAIKEGAYDYIIKPIDKKGLLITLEKVLENIDMERKFELYTRKNYLNELINKELEPDKIKELLHQRHLTGDTVSQEELIALFSKETPLPSLKENTKKKPTILIIEDEDDARKNLSIFLQKKYTPFLAENGKKALAYLDDPSFQPDIILLDIYLPDTTGLDLLPIIKQKKPNTDIIIMTAYRETHVAVKTLREGASDYINKPFLKINLFSTIAKVLQKRYIQNILPELQDKLSQKLPYDKKISLLTERFNILKRQNKLLQMGEVYTFFPELKSSNIAEDFLLPNQLTDKGMNVLIQKLSANNPNLNLN